MKIKLLITLFLVSFFSKVDAYSQIVLSSNAVNNYVAQICGPGVTFSNVSLTGDPAAIASFVGGISGGLGSSMNSGVVMSTGFVNTSNALTGTADKDGNNAGISIPELTSIAGATTYDGIILEFDFVPITSQIAVNYQFGSEEYNWYVNSIFNDAFAFYISGPGITGSQNIALVPSTSVPVTINSINNGYAVHWLWGYNVCSSGPCTNCAYYNDNCNNTFNNAMNGFTTVLTAYQDVTPCETYHIRLMIADGGDEILDSWVFIQEDGLFSVGNPPVASSASSGAGSGVFPEGCTNSGLTFSIPNAQPSDYIFTVSYGGTATSGVDYDALPTTITIPAGSTSVTIPVIVHPDGILEGVETIIVNFPASVCESGVITINITDEIPLTVTASDDVSICSGESVSLSASSSGGGGTVTYTWNNGAGTGNPVTVSSPATYTVTAQDQCGNSATDQVIVSAGSTVTPTFNPVSACLGAVPPVLPATSINGISGTWSPTVINTSASGTSNYTFTPAAGQCALTADVAVTVNELPDVSITTPPQITCVNQTIQLNGTSSTPGAGYLWTGAGVVSGANTQTPTVNAIGVYTLTVTNPATSCTNSANITVTGDGDQPDVSIATPGQISCTNPTLQLSASSSASGISYSWTGPGIVSGTDTQTPIVNQEGTYQVTVTAPNGCTNTESVVVTGSTDIPVVSITIPSLITCTSPTVQLDGSSDSGVTISWTGPGVVSGGNTLNPVVNLPGTYTLTVTNPANNCTNTASVVVTEITTVIPSSFPDTVICGNTFQIPLGDIIANGDVVWSEQGGNGTFSNPNIPNPVFTGVNGVSDYLLVFTDECGYTGSGRVTMVPSPQISSPSVSCHLAELNIVTSSYNGGVWSVVENPGTPYIEDTTLTFLYGDTLNGSIQNTAVSVSHHGSYTLYFHSDDVCPDTSITLNFPPYIFTEINDTVLCNGVQYELTAWENPYQVDYLWNNGSTGTSITVTQPGEYIVTVSNVCYTYSDTANIGYMTCAIEAPNVISLSSQAGNNLWFVSNLGVADFHCVIVNRWGNLIYEFDDVYGHWNGRDMGGNIVSEGVYFYTIEATYEGSEHVTKHGFIHVVH